MRTVLTIGTFDTPHLGHAILLKECEKLGRVYVGINTDEFVIKYKGKPPLYEQWERYNLITQLGYHCHLNNSAGRELIDLVRPDILAIGSDWARKDYYSQIDVDQDYLDENRITMVYIPRVGTLSSTELKSRSNNLDAQIEDLARERYDSKLAGLDEKTRKNLSERGLLKYD